MQRPYASHPQGLMPTPVSSSEIVLRRVYDSHYTHTTNSIHLKAFANDIDRVTGRVTDSHSVSREQYTSADKLRNLAPEPERFGVAAIKVQEYENVLQVVKHNPEEADYGHSDAIGEKPKSVKKRLCKEAILRIKPPPPRGNFILV